MRIVGEKIVLRALESVDNNMLLELLNDPHTEEMVGGSSFPTSAEEQARWFANLYNEKNVLRCAVATKENIENAIRTVILSDINYKNGTAQIHIKMSSGNRKRGYGTDALMAMAKYAISELRLHCIYAEVLENNDASQKMFEKCGFIKEGKLRDRVFKKGKYMNYISYSMVQGEDSYDK